MKNSTVNTKNSASSPNELVNLFSQLSSWEDKYKKIIEIGRDLPAYPEEYRLEDYKVKGCQSQVWLYAILDEDKHIQFYADSDALIVKGLLALLLRLYSGRSPKEILELNPDFIREIGLESNLSPSRSNGLYAMVKQIKYYALAMQSMIDR